ncbi:MAG: DegT/DnrJ/EryC1/StrS family aminotransferase [Candidatus Shapirobacteria bacterium]
MLCLPLAKPYIDQKDIDGVVQTLESGKLACGPKNQLFEKTFSQFIGAKYACTVCNGTAGLHLAVRALDFKAGDEVITTPFSFIASSNCLLFEDLKPVFVDIEENTFNIDPALISQAISPKTKGLLTVDIFGQTPDYDPIIKIARKHKFKIIEDACESVGATYQGKMAGTFGDIGVFAFYPNKQMTTGEGGMIVTSSKSVWQTCQSLKNQGRILDDQFMLHQSLGYNYRMDDLSASLGITQLSKINWMIRQKNKIAQQYTKELKGHPRIITPKTGKNRTNSWFVYVVRITNGQRDKLIRLLANKGINTRPYLPVIHLQPFMRKMFGYKPGDFPIAEKISSQTLALPFYIGLTEDQISFICHTIKKLA